MEINTQQINQLHSITPATPVTKEASDSEKNARTEDTGQQNSNSTLNLSGEALKRSSSTEKSESLQITNSEQARQSVEQFKQDIAENPELIQKMLSRNMTPDEVTRLLG